MSKKDLLRQLRMLEGDYAGQPIVVQRADLREINQLRAQLGLPQVDDKLHEIGVAAVAVAEKPEPVAAPDHSEAREIYQAYLKKSEELAVHQAYADRVAKATSGPGMTPVRPLATMGTDGGPLLCDHCGKAILLEGGKYHNVPADVAWKRNPTRDKWASWISGGLLVEIQTNGTLRIYHGYPGRDDKQCCNVARRNDDKARAKFKSPDRTKLYHKIIAFLEHELPDVTDKERLDVLNKILDVMYSYDPGIGVNRSEGAGAEQKQ